jgi:hypothetical protein
MMRNVKRELLLGVITGLDPVIHDDIAANVRLAVVKGHHGCPGQARA